MRSLPEKVGEAVSPLVAIEHPMETEENVNKRAQRRKDVE